MCNGGDESAIPGKSGPHAAIAKASWNDSSAGSGGPLSKMASFLSMFHPKDSEAPGNPVAGPTPLPGVPLHSLKPREGKPPQLPLATLDEKKAGTTAATAAAGAFPLLHSTVASGSMVSTAALTAAPTPQMTQPSFYAAPPHRPQVPPLHYYFHESYSAAHPNISLGLHTPWNLPGPWPPAVLQHDAELSRLYSGLDGGVSLLASAHSESEQPTLRLFSAPSPSSTGRRLVHKVEPVALPDLNLPSSAHAGLELGGPASDCGLGERLKGAATSDRRKRNRNASLATDGTPDEQLSGGESCREKRSAVVRTFGDGKA